MTKIIFAALTASLVAMPALAQNIDIDDDGWRFVDAPAAATMTVDIDDDGWTRVDAPVVRSGRSGLSADGTCTQLELSAGISGDACGTVSLSSIATIMGSGN
ncbi:hypothetical protein [Jannaschia sp. 2305UL9-9]|uniref:hypothetical protein n=1 Tax=Jannaschia sp. 2305UL9-9 TaxID=3121638 RepID=UPI0035293B3C